MERLTEKVVCNLPDDVLVALGIADVPKENYEIKEAFGATCKENCEEHECYDCPINKVINKLADYEDAEEQGLLLRLPCPIGGTVWGWEFPTRVDEDGTEWTVCDIRRAKIVPKEFILLMLDRIGTNYFLTREEAEQALAEMKGETE